MVSDSLSAPLCMFRRDPSLNMARFYRVEILTDLFGQILLERSWGRVGSTGRSRAVPFPSTRLAEEQALKLIHMKERRGYRRPT